VARLLQIFGFLSMVLCGASLAFQSLTVGGVIFLLLVLRGSGRDFEDTKDSYLGWIRRFALALSAMQTSHLVANAFILMQSAEMGLSDIIAANFVLAGALGLGACFAIVALYSAGRAGSHRGFLLPAAAIMASSVLTSHAMGSSRTPPSAGFCYGTASACYRRVAGWPGFPADGHPARVFP